MSEIEYIQLIDLLNANPNNIENIKEQYLLLLSELTSTSYLETNIFFKNVERINQMGTIIVGVIIDSSNNIEIIASGTIIIEPKIIREGQNVGHIEENKEKIYEKTKEYRENNKEKHQEWQKVWRENNKEILKEKRKIYDEKKKQEKLEQMALLEKPNPEEEKLKKEQLLKEKREKYNAERRLKRLQEKQNLS